MDLFSVHFVGYLAGFLVSISFIPQAIKSIRSKETKSLSVVTYSIYVIAVSLWLTYGLLIMNGPIILWNIVTLIVASAVLVTKLRYG